MLRHASVSRGKNWLVDVCMEQAAHDSGKLTGATVVTVGCSKEEFDRYHRIRPVKDDMEIMLTKVHLPSQSANLSLSLST